MKVHEAPAAAGAGRIPVVVPAYREEKNIGAGVSAVRAQYSYDVLVVNDGSPDGTSGAAKAAGAVVLDLPYNLGIGGAVQSAFLYARDHGYDAVVRIDGDGQHEPRDIGRIISALLDDRADYVIASRVLGSTPHGDPFIHRNGRKLYSALVSLWFFPAFRMRITDSSSGFRVFSITP